MINAYNAPIVPFPTYPQTPQNQPSSAQSSGIVWVQGETGAKAHSVSAGHTEILMDSEDNKFYIKTCDASGIPMPLRIFEYSEITPKTDAVEFVTKADFNEFTKKIENLLRGDEALG